MAASLVNNAQHRLRRLAREFRFRLNGWTVAAVLLGLFLFLPMAEVLWHITSPAENWEHLRDTVLGRYLKGSAILVVGTAGLSLLLGVSTAWLVACCEFPGRRFFEWALILPLAIPTYIAAFAYFDLLDRKMALPPQIGSGTPIRTATCRIRVEIGVQWRLRVAVLRHGPLEFKQRGRPSQPSGVPISTGSGIAALCATSETPRRIDAVLSLSV